MTTATAATTDTTIPMAVLANAKGSTKLHAPECRHTGRARLVEVREVRVVELLKMRPAELADCGLDSACKVANLPENMWLWTV